LAGAIIGGGIGGQIGSGIGGAIGGGIGWGCEYVADKVKLGNACGDYCSEVQRKDGIADFQRDRFGRWYKGQK